MNSNSRYTVAIHILTLLAYCGTEPLTSEFIAGSVHTNPVVIRRLLAAFRDAGWVASQGGPGGGWRLQRDPELVNLADIHRVVEGCALFQLHASEPNPLCPVGRNIQHTLTGIFQDALDVLERHLAQTTLASLVRDVRVRAL